MKISLFILSVLTVIQCSAQNEASTIYWGTCILDFRFSPFQVLSTTAVDSRECAASICDENGNLLFYSNGGKSPLAPSMPAGAWGANGQYLQNGQDLVQLGCNSSQQGAIVLPDPAGITPTSKKYYLLTKDCVEAAVNGNGPDNSGFSYGIIDMLVNGGNGAVISQNNVVVPYDYSQGHAGDHEPLNVVLDTEGELKSGTPGYWVYSYIGDTLFKIHFGINGFDAFSKLFSEAGRIIVSPDRNHLMIKGQLYDLDPPSGNLELIHLFPSSSNGAFSPDGRKIYRMESGKLIQYDLDHPDWRNNPYEVASFSQTPTRYLLLTPSGRIFVYGNDASLIDAQVVCPNNAGLDCGYDPSDLSLQGGTIRGFPNIPAHYLYNTYSTCHLGLDEELSEKILLAPNPSNGHFTIHLNGIPLSNVQLRITDLTGRTIQTEELSGAMEQDHIDIRAADLPNGEYLLELLSKDKAPIVKRLIIKD
jgi:hypothetical protein